MGVSTAGLRGMENCNFTRASKKCFFNFFSLWASSFSGEPFLPFQIVSAPNPCWPWTHTMDLLEEDLTCSVCYSLFCDPRVLPCSHTFCRICLDLLRRSSTDSSILWPHRLSLKCPNCRSVAELTPLGVDALPTNVSLRAIVEKVGPPLVKGSRKSTSLFRWPASHLTLSTGAPASRSCSPARSTRGSRSTCTASRISSWSVACVWRWDGTGATPSMTCRWRSSGRGRPPRCCWPNCRIAGGHRWWISGLSDCNRAPLLTNCCLVKATGLNLDSNKNPEFRFLFVSFKEK